MPTVEERLAKLETAFTGLVQELKRHVSLILPEPPAETPPAEEQPAAKPSE